MAAAPTKAVVSFDQRGQDIDRFPVWEHEFTSTWLTSDTADATHAIEINGTLKKIVLKIPDMTSNGTGQVVIKDNNDETIFDSGEQAENATYTFEVDEPLSGTIDVVVGVSADPSTSGAILVATLRGT